MLNCFKEMKIKLGFLLFMLGLSLWFPAISVINISGSWGLQITQIIVFFLLFFSIRKLALESKSKSLLHGIFFYYYFILISIICVLFTSVGTDRSILTFCSEMLGVFFSIVTMICIHNKPNNFNQFIKGYKAGGFLSSFYAIYQLIGLPLNLPFAFIKFNNSSFSLMQSESALYLGRTFAFTPEPSILASLLIPFIGIMISNFLIFKRKKDFYSFLLALIAFLSTSSQSIIFLPFYLLTVTLFSKIFFKKVVKIKLSRVFLLFIAGLIGLALIISFNDSTAISFSRLINIADNGSLSLRSNDFLISLQLFSLKPIAGWGLGSYGTDIGGVGRITGASSTVIRILVEQGILGFSMLILGVILTLPREIINLNMRLQSSSQASLIIYHFCLIIGFAFSMLFFVGYRSLYHLWMILPLMVSLQKLIVSNRNLTFESNFPQSDSSSF